MIQRICKKIVNEYKKDSNVLGIALFGSAAREKFDQYSDVDIYILLKKKKYSRINFLENKVRVDVILDTLEESMTCIKNDRFNVKRITSNMLAPSKIIYQTTNDLKNIIKKAKQNLLLPTKYTKDEILMHKYSIDDFLGEAQRDIENDDYLAFGLDSQLLLNNIIEFFLKLHKEFWRQPNEMFKILSGLDRNFAETIRSFYKTNNVDTKKQILNRLVMDIYKKAHGSLPDAWKIK